jgi:alpha-L-rhamnosidase
MKKNNAHSRLPSEVRRRWPLMQLVALSVLPGLALVGSSWGAQASPVPSGDKLVVLTFDDGNQSDITYVAPALKRLGFGATFFVTEGLGFGEPGRLSWSDVRELDRLGFEVGNHTRSHPNLLKIPAQELGPQVADFARHCRENGVPEPVSFAYPGGHHDQRAVRLLGGLGYRFARRLGDPETPLIDPGGRGLAYDPRRHHPLLVPSTLWIGENTNLDDLKWAVRQARDGKLAVLTFHGVPDRYPHCSISREDFDEHMQYLAAQKCRVIALRDVARYVAADQYAGDPYASIFAGLGVAPLDLRCETLIDPVGIETRRPRFGWKLTSHRRGQMQAAYQVLVASSEENLARDHGDLWDSGKVASDQSQHVVYGGRRLASGQRCFWKVRLWNRPGEDGRLAVRAYNDPAVLAALRVERASPYSPAAMFQVGLLEPSDWSGTWIAHARGEVSSPLLRKEFTLERKVRRATAFVAGLGYYELFINGEKVGDHVLDPASTYYHHDQDFDIRSRVFYVGYDLTGQLERGPNAIGVMLGHGWYSAEADVPGPPEHRQPYGDRPCLLLQVEIELDDGERLRLVTDGTWQTVAGPVTYNDYSHGETYDARLESPGWKRAGYDASKWSAAVIVDGPNGHLEAQSLPAIRVMEQITPVRRMSPRPGVFVYDMGEMLSGWTRLRLRGERGTRVTLRHAGRVYADGSLDDRTNTYPRAVARQLDTYILRGDGEEVWEPRFTLHGFRFVEVTGSPRTPELLGVQGRFARSSCESSGTFRCSDELVNRVHDYVRRTFACCLQGMPQDAMDRAERVAWLGDPGMVAEDMIYNFDTAAFWNKWLADLRDAQKPDGEIPYVCPLHWRGTHLPYSLLPVWQSSYPLFVWYVYQYYGDERVVSEHYEGMKKLVEYFRARAPDGLLTTGIGDHMEPQSDGTSSASPRNTPAALTSTAYFYADTRILARSANLLGKHDDVRRYTQLATEIKQRFNQEFLNEDKSSYASGSQTSNAVALHLELVPEAHVEAVLATLVDSILRLHEGHLATGIVGTNALEQALPAHGRADVMLRVATRTTFPSWGHQLLQGATTLWETWEDPSARQHSLNMKMLGSTQKFFYHDLAGIRPASPGFSQVEIRPQIVDHLEWVTASFVTPRGPLEIDWRKVAGGLDFRVTVPTNTRAQVSVPTLALVDCKITEGGMGLWQNETYQPGIAGIRAARRAGEAVILEAGGGRYFFRVRGAERQ